MCAPSNAAVDEIIMRIVKYKLVSLSGKTHEISLVRIGAHDYEPPKEVKIWTLDYLVEKELGGNEVIKVDHNKIDEVKWRLDWIDNIIQAAKKLRKENPDIEFGRVHKECNKDVSAFTESMTGEEK